MKATQERIKRVKEALEETERMLAKEEAYQIHLRDKELIEFCRAHKAKLLDMLREWGVS